MKYSGVQEVSKSLNFKGPNRTHAQILTLCVCGLDQRKMAFSHMSHGLEEVPLHDSLFCVGTNHVNRSSYRLSVQPEGVDSTIRL